MSEWNQKMDLTAARSPEELLDLMVADACVLSEKIPSSARVVDVGTGAGAPGLALALLRPDLALTLVEPLAKRTSFLRTALARANREDVRVLLGKVEVVSETYDVALSRATFAPETWLVRSVRLLSPGGSSWVFLAKETPPRAPGMLLADTVSFAWPHTGVLRSLCRYERG